MAKNKQAVRQTTEAEIEQVKQAEPGSEQAEPEQNLAEYDKFNSEFQQLCSKFGVRYAFGVFSDRPNSSGQDPTVCLVGHPYDIMALTAPVYIKIRDTLIKQISG